MFVHVRLDSEVHYNIAPSTSAVQEFEPTSRKTTALLQHSALLYMSGTIVFVRINLYIHIYIYFKTTQM